MFVIEDESTLMSAGGHSLQSGRCSEMVTRLRAVRVSAVRNVTMLVAFMSLLYIMGYVPIILAYNFARNAQNKLEATRLRWLFVAAQSLSNLAIVLKLLVFYKYDKLFKFHFSYYFPILRLFNKEPK